jgi:hypothetical protein
MNLEYRLVRLEAQNRLLRIVAFVALALAGLPWLMASQEAVQDEVRAKRFSLIGDDEVSRGSWTFDQEAQTATLSVQSAELSPSVVLTSSPDNSSVRLLGGVEHSPRSVLPRGANRAAGQMGDADIALTAGKGGTTIKLNDGKIAIERQGKTIFSAPPRTAFLPLTDR